METINLQPAESVISLRDEDALRADIYALLASLCRQHPSEELLAFLSSLEEDAGASNSMAQAWGLLKMAASRANANALEDEYLNIFIGISQGELTPFASWYLTGSLMETPLIELRHDLQLLGYQRDEQVKEPEDHIAVQLEVMSLLIQNGASLERQAVFFQRHLNAWAHQLFADMAEAPSAVFYHAVAMLGQAFIKTESVHLQKIPSAVQSVHLRG